MFYCIVILVCFVTTYLLGVFIGMRVARMEKGKSYEKD